MVTRLQKATPGIRTRDPSPGVVTALSTPGMQHRSPRSPGLSLHPWGQCSSHQHLPHATTPRSHRQIPQTGQIPPDKHGEQGFPPLSRDSFCGLTWSQPKKAPEVTWKVLGAAGSCSNAPNGIEGRAEINLNPCWRWAARKVLERWGEDMDRDVFLGQEEG